MRPMPGFMGNLNGEADRGQVDPAYECLCDLWSALDAETDPAERAVIQAEIDKIKAGK